MADDQAARRAAAARKAEQTRHDNEAKRAADADRAQMTADAERLAEQIAQQERLRRETGSS